MTHSHQFEELVTSPSPIGFFVVLRSTLENFVYLIKCFEDLPINWTLFKFHNIAGESASFIRENELYLAHLLNQIWVSAQTVTSLGVKNVHVFAYQPRLAKFDHFQDYVERDRDQMRVCHLVSKVFDQKLYEPWICSSDI